MAKKKLPVAKVREEAIRRIASDITNDLRDYQGWLSMFWNPNPVLRQQKFQGFHMFEDMDADGHIINVMNIRKEKTLAKQIYVRSSKLDDPVELKKAALARWQIDNIKQLVQKRKEIMSHLDFGFSVTEMILDVRDVQLPDSVIRKNGKETTVAGELMRDATVVVDLENKPVSAFTFNRKNELMMVDSKQSDISSPAFFVPSGYRVLDEEENQHFLVLTHDPRHGSRFGWPVKASMFADWLTKRAVRVFRMIFIEKYGMPFLKGTYPKGTKVEGDAGQKVFEARLRTLQKNSWIMTPEGFAIEFVDVISKTGTIDVFQNALDWADGNISEAGLGHRNVVTGNSSSPFSNDTQESALRQDKLELDAAEHDSLFNDQLIRRSTDWNFTPNGLYPYVVTDVKPAKDLDKLSFRYNSAFNMRVPLSLSQYREDMGFRPPDGVEDTILMPPEAKPIQLGGQNDQNVTNQGQDGNQFQNK